jgi:hypothetical protein
MEELMLISLLEIILLILSWVLQTIFMTL